MNSTMVAKSFTCLLLLLATLHSVSGHGWFTIPAPRAIDPAIRNAPVRWDSDMICKNLPAATPQVTLTAGTTTQILFDLSAPHVGDCFMYMSYDMGVSWFKIKQWAQCDQLTGRNQALELPSWLPACTHCIMRWEWYAIQNWPMIELYVDCIDVRIAGTAGSLPALTPMVTIPGHLPLNGGTAANPLYRNAYNPSIPVFFTGPAVATLVSGGGGGTTSTTRASSTGTSRVSSSSTGGGTTTRASSTGSGSSSRVPSSSTGTSVPGGAVSITNVAWRISWATIYTITWTQSVAASVKLELYSSSLGSIVSIATVTGVASSAGNTYVWTVPASARIASGNDWRIRVSSVSGSSSDTGISAATSLVACTFNPCRVSGSTCSNPTGVCTCPLGVAAAVCNPTGGSSSVDMCATVRCANGGTCSSGTCMCASGWSGSDCTTATTDTCSLNCLNGGVPTADCTACDCTMLYAGTNCAYMSLCLTSRISTPAYTTIQASASTYAATWKAQISKALGVDSSSVTGVTFTANSDGTTTVSFCIYGTFATSAAELAQSMAVMLANPDSMLASGDLTGQADIYEPIDQTGATSATSSSQSWAQKNLIPLTAGLAGGAVLTLLVILSIIFYRRRKAKNGLPQLVASASLPELASPQYAVGSPVSVSFGGETPTSPSALLDISPAAGGAGAGAGSSAGRPRAHPPPPPRAALSPKSNPPASPRATSTSTSTSSSPKSKQARPASPRAPSHQRVASSHRRRRSSLLLDQPMMQPESNSA